MKDHKYFFSLLMLSILSPLAPASRQFDPIPEEITALLDRIKTAENAGDWPQAIALWDTVRAKHATDYIPHDPGGKGRYVGLYNQATLYAKKMHALDSAFPKIASILSDLSGETIGGYESNRPGDVSAVVHWVHLMIAQNQTDDIMLNYLIKLRSIAVSENARAVIDLERANLLYRQSDNLLSAGDRASLSKARSSRSWADQLLEAISLGPPLPGGFFKFAGDFRCSAMTTWAILGGRYERQEHILNRLRALEFAFDEMRIIWISRFVRGRLSYQIGDMESAQRLLQWCVDDPWWAPADYPFTFSEMQTMIAPYDYTFKAKEMLNKIDDQR